MTTRLTARDIRTAYKTEYPGGPRITAYSWDGRSWCIDRRANREPVDSIAAMTRLIHQSPSSEFHSTYTLIERGFTIEDPAGSIRQ